MKLDSPQLVNASLLLEQSLSGMEDAIGAHSGLQQQIDRSWRQIDDTLKALGRRWDWANQSLFRKQHARHARLQKQLVQAHDTCIEARKELHSARAAYDLARTLLSKRSLGMVVELAQLHRANGGLSRAFDHVQGQLKTAAAQQGENGEYDILEGAYDYIPLDVPSFLSLLVRLDELLVDDPDYCETDRRYRPVSMVEVGCGPGRNLVIARESKLLTFSALSGFDINPVLVALGQRAFGLTGELQVADAMTFDYSPFDIVFSFRPFSDIEMLSALEAHIVGSMRKNAYLLAPLAHDLRLYPELMSAPDAPNIWKKTG